MIDVLVWFVLDVVIELLVKGPGYLIIRVFRRNADPDGGWTVCVGLALWTLVIGGGYLFYQAYLRVGS